MKNKLIVLDLDGTLLTDSKTLSEYTINVLNKKLDEKNIIVFATARPYRDLAGLLPESLMNNPLICDNGSTVFYQGKKIFNMTLDSQKASRIIKYFFEHGYEEIAFEMNDELYANFDVSKFFGNYAYNQFSINELKPYDINRILIFSEKKIEEKLVENIPFECNCILTDNAKLCQIMETNVDKWTAIKFITEYFNYDNSEIIAIGNDRNDIEMIKNADLGVAMQNAINELKAIADQVTLHSNNCDGAAKFLSF